jgi:hypothetical protein
MLSILLVLSRWATVQALATPKSAASTSIVTNTATIRVCSGGDCRVDGSSECLRRLQQHPLIQQQRQRSKDAGGSPSSDADDDASSFGTSKIRIISTPCLGPCGDGPNVVVMDDRLSKRVVETRPVLSPKSLVPADMMGDNSRGVYQVRTQNDIDFVINLAAQTAGVKTTGSASESTSSSTKRSNTDVDEVIITGTRTWYDRPRNERKVMQRLMQFLILVGLYDQYKTNGVVEEEQWRVSLVLFAASFIIKKKV